MWLSISRFTRSVSSEASLAMKWSADRREVVRQGKGGWRSGGRTAEPVVWRRVASSDERGRGHKPKSACQRHILGVLAAGRGGCGSADRGRRGEARRVNGREHFEEGVGTRIGRSSAGFGPV